MNRMQEILVVTMEECSEVAIEASKIVRFGYEKSDSLESEIGDLYCMIKILEEEGMINMENVKLCAQAKRNKLKQWSNIFDDEPDDFLSNEIQESLPFV